MRSSTNLLDVRPAAQTDMFFFAWSHSLAAKHGKNDELLGPKTFYQNRRRFVVTLGQTGGSRTFRLLDTSEMLG